MQFDIPGVDSFRVLNRHPSLLSLEEWEVKSLLININQAHRYVSSFPVKEGYNCFTQGEEIVPHLAKMWEERGYTNENFYRKNSWGFRYDEFSEHPTNSAMALGCSNTVGVGLPEKYRWSNLLADKLGKEVVNLGQTGVGLDAIYRLALGWIPIMRPKTVFLLMPPSHRIEFPCPDERFPIFAGRAMNFAPAIVETILSEDWEKDENRKEWMRQKAKHYMEMLENPWWFNVHNQRNLDALRQLCLKYGARIFTIDYKVQRKFNQENRDRLKDDARDGGHPNTWEHEFYADTFFKMHESKK